MGKIVYVNGTIVVKTKFFAPLEMGCGYPSPPEGAEEIEPSDEIDGCRCLIIDDDHPQSLFKEYYASGSVTFGEVLSSYLSASCLDCIDVYKKRVTEICEVIKKVSDWDAPEKALVYKMAYVNILTALDAFICNVLIARSVTEEKLFMQLTKSIAPGGKKEKWQRMRERGELGEWEQDAIRQVLEKSFINSETIDKSFKMVRYIRLEYDRKEADRFFRIRHVIVHRNGKQIDDTVLEVTYQLLADLVNECHTIVGAIFDSVCITLDRELKSKPKQPDIKEIFPGGRVCAPFKLSDLRRFLMDGAPTVPFEPIELPVL